MVSQEIPEAHLLSLYFRRRCSTYSVSQSIAIDQFTNSQRWCLGEEPGWGGTRAERCMGEGGDVSTHDCESSERALKRKARLPAGDE